MKITPVFNVQEVWNEGFGFAWFVFQDAAFEMGKRMHTYMVNYLSASKKRRSKVGSSLANNIKFHTTGKTPGSISWGIGDISQLQKTNPYWYVLNYGKKVSGEVFIPGGGQFRPVMYSDGRPLSTLAGHGTGAGTAIGRGRPVSPIRPIPYIDITQWKLDRAVQKILAMLRAQ